VREAEWDGRASAIVGATREAGNPSPAGRIDWYSTSSLHLQILTSGALIQQSTYAVIVIAAIHDT
jgi:hypothetical protein